jgi:GAF domain-containing protein
MRPRLCEGNFAVLWQFDGDGLVGASHHNVSPGFAELCRNTKLRPGPEGAVRKAALERHAVHVPDITVEPGFSPVVLQFENARTVLAVPLLREQDLLGVIDRSRLPLIPDTDVFQRKLAALFRQSPHQRIGRFLPQTRSEKAVKPTIPVKRTVTCLRSASMQASDAESGYA